MKQLNYTGHSWAAAHITRASSCQTRSQNGEDSWAHNPTPCYGTIPRCLLLGRARVFFKTVASEKSTKVHRELAHPRPSGQYKLCLKGFNKRIHSWISRKGVGSWKSWGKVGEYDQNTLYDSEKQNRNQIMPINIHILHYTHA